MGDFEREGLVHDDVNFNIEFLTRVVCTTLIFVRNLDVIGMFIIGSLPCLPSGS